MNDATSDQSGIIRMMRETSVFRCQSCGWSSRKWLGRCPECGEWNTFVEEAQSRKVPSRRVHETAPIPLVEIQRQEGDRVPTGIGELDRVLGGGVVPGSLTLIGGDPGIGKSTLLLQVSQALAERSGPVLYVSGEESAAQIKLRADRLGIVPKEVWLLAETSLEAIEHHVVRLKPRILVIDSIQTVHLGELESAPGSVGQVRECGARLMLLAKGQSVSTFLAGHVTKEGAIAGPRVLEHLVDTVLYFEGETHHAHRVLRAVKNRFGSTNEIGLFEMTGEGLREVVNPSEFFLAERPRGASGSVVIPGLEGTRPLLRELQALVTPASFGTPRRTVIGADYNRVCLLLAILEKRASFPLQSQDVFVNVAGGGRLLEPAADLGICLAAASSFTERPVAAETVVLGEVGLTGEVRAVSGFEVRLREASALGFKRALVPRNNVPEDIHASFSVQGVRSVEEAIGVLLD